MRKYKKLQSQYNDLQSGYDNLFYKYEGLLKKQKNKYNPTIECKGCKNLISETNGFGYSVHYCKLNCTCSERTE